jgi:hypothetical protein
MNDQEKLNHLKMIFSKQIEWYHEHIEDDDYMIDQAFDQFKGVEKADWVELLIILGAR